jgi:hypothetical protein
LPQLSGLSEKSTASVPMVCENGVCRPATIATRPRLFRR